MMKRKLTNHYETRKRTKMQQNRPSTANTTKYNDILENLRALNIIQ